MAPYYRNVTRGWYHEYHGLSEYEMGVLCWRSRDDIHIHQTLTGVKCKQASRESEQPPSRPSPKYGNLLCTMGWDTQGGGAQISSFLLFLRDWSRELFKNWRRSQHTNTHQSPTGGDLIKSVLFLAKKVKSKIRIQFPQWPLFTFFTVILSPLSSVYNSTIFTFVRRQQENAASEKMLPLWRRTRL